MCCFEGLSNPFLFLGQFLFLDLTYNVFKILTVHNEIAYRCISVLGTKFLNLFFFFGLSDLLMHIG